MISYSTPRRRNASTSNFSSTRTREARIAIRMVLFPPVFFHLRSQGHFWQLNVQNLKLRVAIGAIENLADQQPLQTQFCLAFRTLCNLRHLFISFCTIPIFEAGLLRAVPL